jgi:hypothetical protein
MIVVAEPGNAMVKLNIYKPTHVFVLVQHQHPIDNIMRVGNVGYENRGAALVQSTITLFLPWLTFLGVLRQPVNFVRWFAALRGYEVTDTVLQLQISQVGLFRDCWFIA